MTFDSLSYGDLQSTQIQDAVSRLAESLGDRFLSGRLIEGVSFEANKTKLVSHGLGRSDVRVAPFNVQVRPFGFRAYMSAAAPTYAGFGGKLPFDTVAYDDGGDFDTANNWVTIPETAEYEITAQMMDGTVLPAGRVIALDMFRASGGIFWWGDIATTSVAIGNMRVNTTLRWRLSAGEQIFAQNLDGAGAGGTYAGGISNADRTYFTATMIGSPTPYVDAKRLRDTDQKRFVPVFAERPITCDLWVY